MDKNALSDGLKHDLDSSWIDAVECLKRFDNYLLHVQGLAPRTREGYCFWVSRFFKTFFGTAGRDLSSLRGEDLTMYVQREASRLKRNARGIPGTAIRGLLRYLVFAGVIRGGLESAIPRMPKWKYADLPRYLPPEDIDRAVAGVLRDSAAGRRNHAILLLLARTGMRAGDVANLTLDDIDWRKGTIRIRSGKSRHERHLPLTQEVGSALCSYLQHGRPPCSSRAFFLRVLSPLVPFQGSAAICRIARRALTRAGIVNTPGAAHLFRHSVATQMVRGGASFKDIADVLGHASLKTTAIYAKLDLAALSRVALSWPGSVS
jgi:integrase/recombinase XerD